MRRYLPNDAALWDEWVARSKNGTFLLRRPYLEYHADRFEDHSLMFFRDDRLIAVLAACRQGVTLSSHAGLSYGGLVIDGAAKIATVVDAFSALVAYGRTAGFRELVYKPVPRIYHRLPADEDLYALFSQGARLVGRSASLTLARGTATARPKFRPSAHGPTLTVEASDDFEGFMGLVAEMLRERYGAAPTHSAAEMRVLVSRFPEAIRLFVVRGGTQILAGTIAYETPAVAHLQYVAASARGRALDAGDRLFDRLIREIYVDKAWFDFGGATEDGGRYLNRGLAAYKESFGARTTVCDVYALPLV